MQLLFKDYTNLVLKAYEEGRDADRLSQLLIHPTTANIRDECLNVYNERIKRGEEEENTLRAFFGVPPAAKNFGYLIQRCSPDRFRPLQSLIRKEVKNPAPVNVELLAWLIDFTPRPLANAQRILADKTTLPSGPLTGNNRTEVQQDQEMIGKGEMIKEFPAAALQNKTGLSDDKEYRISGTGSKDPNGHFIKRTVTGLGSKKLRIVVVTGLVMAVIFGGIYSFEKYMRPGNTRSGNSNGECMYWAGDQYRKVACNEEPKGRLFLPLNEDRMNNFKRITNVDTITENSIGVIYYIKIGGKIEYYTTDGNHPVYVTRTLKVLTQYMFDNHLRNKEASPGTSGPIANE